ncbi:Glycopeptide [Mycena sanguinolenta]|uniref:Glycopeptide n=1 Tax=Mycena sanguinolenta TaxID=230812 RepID=A0A8H6XHB5_9AGAR|nr:Glycopeptide [Mycena sanguinolenta]
MFSSIKAATLAVIAVAAGKALAESHTVTFANNCGFGTPTLIGQGGAVLSTGGAYTSNGPLVGAIAYLQTGELSSLFVLWFLMSTLPAGGCGFNGEGCTLVETTLVNPTCAGCGSSTDLSLIPPHAFSVTTGFGYLGSCSPAGADCNNANCNTAFHQPSDTFVQVACQADDANLVITFCL